MRFIPVLVPALCGWVLACAADDEVHFGECTAFDDCDVGEACLEGRCVRADLPPFPEPALADAALPPPAADAAPPPSPGSGPPASGDAAPPPPPRGCGPPSGDDEHDEDHEDDDDDDDDDEKPKGKGKNKKPDCQLTR